MLKGPIVTEGVQYLSIVEERVLYDSKHTNDQSIEASL